MKTVNMSGSLRENVGKSDAKKLRNKGQVPCVIYGGEEQVHFYVDERQFSKLVFTPEVHFVNIDLNGKTFSVILQDIQYHPVTDKIIHADFLEINEAKEITMAIPVKLTGNSGGVLRGGKLHLRLRKLIVKALPGNMPEEIVLDITPLEIGDSIKIKDIQAENFALINKPSEAVVNVKTARGITEEEEEEEAAAAEAAAAAEEGEGGEESASDKDSKDNQEK